MAVNVGKVRKKIKDQQRLESEREEKRKSFVNWFQPEVGQSSASYFFSFPIVFSVNFSTTNSVR